MAVAPMPRYHTRGSPPGRHTDVPWKGFCKSAVLSARTDVCALDGSGMHIDYPEQGGTSVGARARGLSSCIPLYCLNVC